MQINSASEMRQVRKTYQSSVGFVPTMGALHQGHESLIKIAKKNSEIVIVSIFVNSTQFSEDEDFDHYPRQLQNDLLICKELGVDFVFTPSEDDIYPNGETKSAYTPSETFAKAMCGKSRPHFFYGVCNVVQRLLTIINPTSIVLGDKDLQQRLILEQMINDLNLDVKVLAGPIIRDKNGLALSSRNQYLNKDQYKISLTISKSLHDAAIKVKNQHWNSYQVRQFIAAQIEARG